MKHKILLALPLSILAVHMPSLATEQPASSEERIQHYEVEAPKDSAEALLVIEDALKSIEADLAANKLEAIHEQSYHLEAAVETLRKDAKNAGHMPMIDAFDEATQIIHFASENGESDKIRAELPTLKSAAEKIKAAL